MSTKMSDGVRVVEVERVPDDETHVSCPGWAIFRLTHKDWLGVTPDGRWCWTTNPRLRVVKATREDADYVLECAQARGIEEDCP